MDHNNFSSSASAASKTITVSPSFSPGTKAGTFQPLDVQSTGSATSYLENNLRENVVGTLQKTLKTHPEKPLSAFVETLRESNTNKETKIIQLPKIAEVVDDATLTGVKYRRRRDRLTIHPNIPLHIEIDPTLENMVTTISEAKAKLESQLQRDIQAVTSGDSSQGTGVSNLVSSALSRRAQATDVTEFGKAAADHLPTTVDLVKIFILSPTGRELVFVDSMAYLGNVAIRRSARKTDFSFVRQHAAGNKSKHHSGGGDASINGANGTAQWSDSDSDADSELMEEAVEPTEDLEQQICDAVFTASLCRKCFPANAVESQITQLYSKTTSSLSISVTRIVTPSDRISMNPHVFDAIDAALGIDDSSPVVPVVVFAFGFQQDLVLRSIVTGIATTLGHHYEVKALQINQLIQIVQDEKRRIRLAQQAAGNQIHMNPSGYWMKVRERREARDRRRDQMTNEKKKRNPVAPIPSNLGEAERTIAEADRQRAADERETYLKNLDRRLHEAALKRQARRAREDTDAAEAITKSFAASAVVVQCIIRGFLTRRRLNQKNRRGSFRQQFESASPLGRVNLIERYAAHSYQGKNRNRTETDIPWSIERDVLMSLVHDYPEALTGLAPRSGAKHRVYKTWLPERGRVPPAHDDDVSSEDEAWICTTREIHPRLQTARFRLVNPYTKTQKQLEACNCDLDEFLRTTELHFSKISPLQRRAFAAIQAKCMHMLHTAFLDLNSRDQLPPVPRNLSTTLACKSFMASPVNKNRWTFTGFLQHHHPELESWFNMPHFVSQRLHEVAVRHSSILAQQACPSLRSHNIISNSAPNNNPLLLSPGGGSFTTANSCSIPILATSYVAFEDLNAGTNWASMAEANASAGKLMSGAAIAKYMRSEGAVQLGPTRVFLVSDTMKTGQVQACLQALNESYKCKKLRWVATSPFPTAYVYDRAVFACSYSEHLAKSSGIFRDVNEVMLEGKLNPEAAVARERATAERRLAEKQALEKSQAAERAAANQVSTGAAPLSPTGKANERPRPGLRSGFVGRTIAGRTSRSASQGPSADGVTPEPPTARGALGNSMSNEDNNNNDQAASTNNNNNNLAGGTTTPRPQQIIEPNTAVTIKLATVVDKLTLKKKPFAMIGNSPSTSSSQPKDSFISNTSSQGHGNNNNNTSGVIVTGNEISDASHFVSQQYLLDNVPSSMSESPSMSVNLSRSDLTWFGTSWLDLDARLTRELIKQSRDESGSIYVTIPTRGFEDPTPKPIDDILGKSTNPSASLNNGEAGEASTNRPSSAMSHHSGSPRVNNKDDANKKKPPAGLTLMLGRFPTRTSPLVVDVRSFKCLEAKSVRIVVTIPLKKTNSAHSLGSNGAIRGPGASGQDLGASRSSVGGASMHPAISNLSTVKLDSRAPRTQSRMVRSMSRVTAAVPGGGTLSAGGKKNSCAVESDEEVEGKETPPPDPAALIVTPQVLFSKYFPQYGFDDATFVRFPVLAIGGTPWIQTVSQLIRDSFLHMSRGGADEVCTVISVSTSDDIFYALVVALINEIIFSEETLAAKARKAAAQKNAAIAAHNLPPGAAANAGGGGGVKFDSTAGGGSGGASSGSNSPNSASSPSKNTDHISKLSTGLSKVASRRFQPVAQAIPLDSEDYSAPTATPEELDAFCCINNWIERHDQDSVELQYAALELDCMINKCGLWTTFKMPVIDAKRRAEMARGTLDIRQFIRDACCGLERYLWLLVITRCLIDFRASNPRKNQDEADSGLARASLSIQKGADSPQLMPFVEWRLGKQFFEFLNDGIDPWYKTPKLSPDFGHQNLYSMWPQRWFRNMFTTSII